MLACIFTVSMTFIFVVFEIEMVEAFFEFTRDHEDWQLDELLMGVVWLGIASAFYAIQRIRDIKKLNKAIVQNAYFDAITGLPNRSLALDRLDSMLAGAKRRNTKIAVAFLDFDRFKSINDSYGHEVGDQLIREVGERFAAVVRKEELAARLGGDEFLVIAEFEKGSNQIVPLVTRLQQTQNTPFLICGHKIHLKYSIGVSVFPEDGSTVDELVRAADSAMYVAKKSGLGQFEFYSDALGQRLSERHHLSQDLKQALEQDELFMVYQPIVLTSEQTVTGYEALIRWQRKGEFVSPELLISVAEEYGLIHEIGQWVFREALSEASQSLSPSQFMSINVSVNQFLHKDFVEIVKCEIERAGVDPERVELEITETAIVSDLDWTSKQLAQLKSLGLRISIDDFGVAYSSIGRLKSLMVDKIKIDRSFIAGIAGSHRDQGIIEAILLLASKLDLSIVAEGVETNEQAQLLARMNCNTMQGFLFSKPEKMDQLNLS
ncbi:putative bifunctional diguanylate cyclase/phosphodiesterase [Corallincola platygyrae]|uniref:Bifunctional diguanylate cyclase/phosphodiesterase n=1 Tax=Corallincola platygyrae TaxID=1193278 RepID=A0ABW4XNQ1_9GAMM